MTLERIPNAIRWILIIPVFILIYMFFNLISGFLAWFWNSPGSLSYILTQEFLRSGLSAYVSIIASCAVAPKGQKIIAGILSALFILLSGGILMLILIGRTEPTPLLVVTMILTLGGAVWAFLEILRQPQRNVLTG